MAKTVQGKRTQWMLLNVIGKGDAGEVLRVQTELNTESGVMKRPVQNVSGGTMIRQALQIENEGKVLGLFEGLNYQRGEITIHTPLLLDESISGTSRTAHLFIVSEQVSGISIDQLLQDMHRGGKAIPKVLVVKVLSGLLNLLFRVHSFGIVWNDVKTEHIFWDEAKNQLNFIDWGNALFFDPELGFQEKQGPSLDFAQMLTEGKHLIEQTYPELESELGWPVIASQINPDEMTALRFRTEYLAMYFSMRVTDYRLQFQKLSDRLTDPNLLRDALKMRQDLLDLGVTPQDETLLECIKRYSSQLIFNHDWETLHEITGIILESGGLDQPDLFNLLHYVSKLDVLKSFDEYPLMLDALQNQNIVEAHWLLNKVQSQTPDYNLDQIISATRKLQIISNDTPIDLFEQLNNFKRQSPDLSSNITSILENWGVSSRADSFGIEFVLTRELLTKLDAHGQRVPFLLRQTIHALLGKVRQIYLKWNEGDLESVAEQLKDLYFAEPSLAYLPPIQTAVTSLISWIEKIKDGPQSNQTITRFAQELVDAFPALVTTLGKPAWLLAYWHCVSQLATVTDLDSLRDQASADRWPTPWIANQHLQTDLPDSVFLEHPLSQENQQLLQSFHKAAQQDSEINSYLNRIKSRLPQFTTAYRKLSDAYNNLFSPLHTNQDLPELARFPAQDREHVEQFYDLLNYVESWKSQLSRSSLIPGLPEWQQEHDWQILKELEDVQNTWFKTTLPILVAIRQKKWDNFPKPSISSQDSVLHQACVHLQSLWASWQKIPNLGIFPENTREMSYQIEQAQTHFFKYWQTQESSNSRVLRWLTLVYQSFYSQINRNLLLIGRQLRTIMRSLDVVNTPLMARTRLAQNSAGDLVFALVQLESLLQPPSRKRSIPREWQKQYLDLLQQSDRAAILEGIATIDSIHPLLPWFDELVRRDSTYFETPDEHKW